MKIEKKDSVFYLDGKVYTEKYPIELWDSPQVFHESNVRGYEPMTAKELDTEELQDYELSLTENFIEEKFDGTRALVYFFEDGCRVFSRRVSKKTGFYVENTDSLPQFRELVVPNLSGTILDGEMFINDRPFKDVSSTLNCKWDKAIDRQLELGFITMHSFDILFYKGIDLRRMPLERRKVYLHLAVEEARCKYLEEVPFVRGGGAINIEDTRFCKQGQLLLNLKADIEKESYPNAYSYLREGSTLTPRAYYELIVATGGEGVIVKSSKGRYNHKRGWEYSKIKKFLTRELIVIGFEEPTKEYTGKELSKWAYWERNSDNKKLQGNFYGDPNYTPITRHYFYEQVGVMKLGVIISHSEYDSLKPNKRGAIEDYDKEHYIMEVCECSGFDDETRAYFTDNLDSIIGSVVEIKANEIFKDSGKMRHPRYLRVREDKAPEQCIWEDHIL